MATGEYDEVAHSLLAAYDAGDQRKRTAYALRRATWPSDALTAVHRFDDPITAQSTENGRTVVASGGKVFRLGETNFRWVGGEYVPHVHAYRNQQTNPRSDVTNSDDAGHLQDHEAVKTTSREGPDWWNRDAHVKDMPVSTE